MGIHSVRIRTTYLTRAAAICLLFGCLALQGQAPVAAIPNFAPDDRTSWHPDRPDGDNFLPPESGPGPIMQVPDIPYVPNGGRDMDFASTKPTYRIADLSNPILQPWVRDIMKVDNDAVRAGQKIPFMARERCYPGGVPEWNIFRRVAAPMVFFVQTPKEVLIIWRGDSQVRHIYVDVPHSANPKPSWYGESVGHYDGDALVVDTIGLSTKTFVDNYRTPHTEQLHVVERFHLINDGKKMEVDIHVEDPGAFTTPWNAIQRFALNHPNPRPSVADNKANGTLYESSCAESAAFDHFTSDNYGSKLADTVAPVPVADKGDF
jgi:hypothetical protein